ncbi:hypothetical protein ROV96_19500 [Stenotrophomonas pavanii]|uniref:hypothetical protein n=1 Tax=Stenotrophomonas pavanii TaxID=487698 RepID=UPI0028940502|nr:hypothetical protein [Stenotrophomonas pavanii]MDT3457364.1 hypothetical protein [Stenotrophomonas pavanii]MDT3466124.1 hypothetical protein [Stenotrophomonas pavanii]
MNRQMLALGRLKTGEMNRTEAAYAEHLRALQAVGNVQWHRFEGMKLRLADKTFYTPDFAVMAADGVMECHEVKGALAGRCTGQDQDRSFHVPLPLHRREGQAKAGWRWLGSGGVLMDRIDTRVRAGRRLPHEQVPGSADGAPEAVHSNRGGFGPRSKTVFRPLGCSTTGHGFGGFLPGETQFS